MSRPAQIAGAGLLVVVSIAAQSHAVDLTTNGGVEARYLVNLGQPYGETVGSAGNIQGLYDYASSPGNAAHWWEINNGVLDSSCNTFGSANVEDFGGYQFKLPAEVTQIVFANRLFEDGGTFLDQPRVEVLDKPIKQGGQWQAIAVTWDTPYDNSFGVGFRKYTITPEQPTGEIWGLRLIGAPRPQADGNGFIAVGELQLFGDLSLPQPVDLHNNLALHQTPLWSHLQFNRPERLTDGIFTENNTETTWGATGDDYIGVLFSSTQYNVASVGVGLRYFFDGGGFDPPGGVKVQYTQDGGTNWVDVNGLNPGRWAADHAELAASAATLPEIVTFLWSFDPVEQLNGIRIIGNPGGPADGDGFVGAVELEVFGIPFPAQVFDYDRNGFIDHADAVQFANCVSGPEIPQTIDACKLSDIDKDGDVDMIDFSVFQRCYRGAEPIDITCGT